MKAADALGFKGTPAKRVTLAASAPGGVGASWLDLAEQVLTAEGCLRCMRGRDLFDELPLHGLPAVMYGTAHTFALRTA